MLIPIDARVMPSGHTWIMRRETRDGLNSCFLSKRHGARRFPTDFKAGLSPTANLMSAMIQEGMASDMFRSDDVWEITFEMGALSHGLIMLYLGGRIDASPAGFRDLYRRSFQRYIRGIRR